MSATLRLRTALVGHLLWLREPGHATAILRCHENEDPPPTTRTATCWEPTQTRAVTPATLA
eukprot:13249867-Alexandrium_andersonii.AAC.1